MRIISLPTKPNHGPVIVCNACNRTRFWIEAEHKENPQHIHCLRCDHPADKLHGKSAEIEVFEIPTATCPDGLWKPEIPRTVLTKAQTGLKVKR